MGGDEGIGSPELPIRLFVLSGSQNFSFRSASVVPDLSYE